MMPDYENLNRDETLEAVSDFDAQRLAEFIEFEREHKNRKTVIEPLERQLVEVAPEDTSTQYVAGIWWDEPSEAKMARTSSRVREAIEDGRLRRVN